MAGSFEEVGHLFQMLPNIPTYCTIFVLKFLNKL